MQLRSSFSFDACWRKGSLSCWRTSTAVSVWLVLPCFQFVLSSFPESSLAMKLSSIWIRYFWPNLNICTAPLSIRVHPEVAAFDSVFGDSRTVSSLAHWPRTCWTKQLRKEDCELARLAVGNRVLFLYRDEFAFLFSGTSHLCPWSGKTRP